MISLLKNQYLAVLWGLFILIMCDIPIPKSSGPKFFEGFDKLVHTGFFFVLTVLLFFGSAKGRQAKDHRLITTMKVLIATACFGGLIEMMQLEIFTYRSAEWWDFFADMTGVGMGIFSYLILYKETIVSSLLLG